MEYETDYKYPESVEIEDAEDYNVDYDDEEEEEEEEESDEEEEEEEDKKFKDYMTKHFGCKNVNEVEIQALINRKIFKKLNNIED